MIFSYSFEANAASKATLDGWKSVRRTYSTASRAPCSRSMPLSSHLDGKVDAVANPAERADDAFQIDIPRPGDTKSQPLRGSPKLRWRSEDTVIPVQLPLRVFDMDMANAIRKCSMNAAGSNNW
jgi:hypothetical protein